MRSEIFLPEAEIELREAARYYESKSRGLGSAFIHEIRKSISQLLGHPEIGSPVRGGIRKSRVSRFPYHVFYAIEENSIVIIALAHEKRRPGYWKTRERS